VKNPFEQYPVIEFKDIRKGDTIAAVHKDINSLRTTMGVAELKYNYGNDSDYWYTQGGSITLARTGIPNTTIHLIDRITPKLPTEAGDAIFIKKYDGVVLEEPVLAVRHSDADFIMPTIDSGGTHTVFSSYWLSPSQQNLIQEWTLAEVKEVTV
jgi:hypothetical protein